MSSQWLCVSSVTYTSMQSYASNPQVEIIGTKILTQDAKTVNRLNVDKQVGNLKDYLVVLNLLNSH